MSAIIPDHVPDHFPAGTTVTFTRSFADYKPADGWAYTIYLNGLTAKFSKAATTPDDSSADFLITFLPTDTASLAPGAYRYAERLSNSGTGEVRDLTGDERVINIEPNVASSAAGAFATWEERTLAIVEAAISGTLPEGIQSYQIAGRAVSRYRPDELMKLRSQLRVAVWRLQHPGQLMTPYKIEFPPEGGEVTEFPPTWVDFTGLG